MMHNELLAYILAVISVPYIVIGLYKELFAKTDGVHLILIGTGLNFLALGFFR